jgi:hypothetical protein
MTEGQAVANAEYVLFAGVFSAWALALLVIRLGRSRAGLSIGFAIGAAFLIRIAAAGVISVKGSLAALRGTDESVFLSNADQLRHEPFFSSQVLSWISGDLHVWLFSVQMRITGGTPEFGMRVVQIALSVAAICLVAAAVYDLAGARAATIFAWVMAIEPNGVFFSSLLHKESLVYLGEALVILGAAQAWRRIDRNAVLLLAAGSAIAGATRYYIGGFLAAASCGVLLHAALRARGQGASRQLLALAPVLVVVGIGLHTLSPARTLTKLQYAQTVTATGYSNLRLEPVNFSSWSGIATGLPKRFRDVLLRPYPWQLTNTSQRVGVLGTLVAWTILLLLVYVLVTRPRDLVSLGAPVLYPLVCIAAAYALTTSNAGTGFRYRIHILMLMLALLSILYIRRSTRSVARADQLPLRIDDPTALTLTSR